MNFTTQLIITPILLLLAILLFGITPIDFVVQDHFFNFQTHHWILNPELQPYKFIFYDGIKKLLILFAVTLLIALFLFKKHTLIQTYKQGLIIVVLSAIFVPIINGGMKKYTNMPCPKNEMHYGGVYPTTKVWEHYPKEFKQPDKIRCWPAGHASGGFALLSLFFLFKQKRTKVLSLLFALGVGWSMGLYKMLIGDHFLSHTVITMILSWFIILIIKKSIRIQ